MAFERARFIAGVGWSCWLVSGLALACSAPGSHGVGSDQTNGGSSSGGASRGGATSGGSSSGGASSGGASSADAGSSAKAGSAGRETGSGGGSGGTVTVPSPCEHGALALSEGTWVDITPAGVGTAPCTDLEFDPSDTCTLYAVYGGAGIWKSTDGGSAWTKIGNLPMPNSLGRILVDPKNGQHLYTTGSVGGSSLGFWISHDGGNTWAMPQAFVTGMTAGTWTNDVYNMVVDPTDFDHVVLTLHYTPGPSAPILESTNGGSSFIAHAADPGMDHAQGLAMLYDPARGLGDAKTWLVGAGYGSGIFRTTNAGETWTRVSDAQQNHGGFDVHYSTQGFLAIGVTGNLLRSTDNGVTWTTVTKGVPYAYYYSVIGDGTRLYTSPAFVGVDQHQPFLTSPEGGADEGSTWTKYSDQILPSGPWKMTFDPANRVLYNASWGKAWALKVKP